MNAVDSFSEGMIARLIELDRYVYQHTGEQGIFKLNVSFKVYQSMLMSMESVRRFERSQYSTVISMYTQAGEIEIQPVKGHDNRGQPCRYCGNNKYNDSHECLSCGAKWKSIQRTF